MRTQATAGLASVLFGKSMRGILAQLYGRPDRRFYVREIARAAGTPPSSLQRDLAALAGAGIIDRHENGRQVYYQANLNCPIFGELKGIVTKTFGVADYVR
jgi:DNA-binding transcriptional ArsR family regulator